MSATIENQKVKDSIQLLRNAESEKDVLKALRIKEDVSWIDVDAELQDDWHEAYGDVKHYHPN